jgi:hypothetical protein
MCVVFYHCAYSGQDTFLHNMQTGSEVHPAYHIMGTRNYFPCDRAAGLEAHHSLLFNLVDIVMGS